MYCVSPTLIYSGLPTADSCAVILDVPGYEPLQMNEDVELTVAVQLYTPDWEKMLTVLL